MRKLIATLVTALVACALFTVPGQAAPGSGTTTRADAKDVDIVPLTAVEHVERTVPGSDGVPRTTHEKNRLYRDSAGRTRHETATTVTINDPASRTTTTLDKATRTFTRTVAPARQSRAQGPVAAERQVSSAPRSLGSRVVGGVRAEGTAYTLTMARPAKPALTKEVTTWIAEDIQLDVALRTTDPDGASYAKTYGDIRTGVAPTADLFTVPAGYRAAGQTASAAVDCPVEIGPDPLVLVSYGLVLLGSGVQRGATDFAGAGCLIVDSVAVVQNPLWAAPVTPLGLSYFDWFFYDNGDPFVPCNSVAFGAAGFLAAGTEDTSDKFSVVGLYIYC